MSKMLTYLMKRCCQTTLTILFVTKTLSGVCGKSRSVLGISKIGFSIYFPHQHFFTNSLTKL